MTTHGCPCPPCRTNSFSTIEFRDSASSMFTQKERDPDDKLLPLMKLSDYIVEQLADWGVRHIFLVTGGGAMHINDSIGKEPRIQYFCNHHDKASAMAAEGYARISGQT